MPPAPAPAPPAAPPRPVLRDGMRLNRREFHRRYEAICESAPDFKAELIGGVVYLPDPMGAGNLHAIFGDLIGGWLWEYRKRTPGVKGGDAPTVQLDDLGEPQPDRVLRRVGPGPDVTGYLTEAPELVVEVSDSTLQKDLGPKFRDYQRAGVPEYLVVDIPNRRVHWFVRGGDGGGAFVRLEPDADGPYRSREFPGLWLDPAALFAEDVAELEAAVVAGVAGRDVGA